MSEAIKPTTNEVITTEQDRVACDGPEHSKHPRVYLTIKGGTEGEVVCPYCGRIYKKK